MYRVMKRLPFGNSDCFLAVVVDFCRISALSDSAIFNFSVWNSLAILLFAGWFVVAGNRLVYHSYSVLKD